MSINDSEFALAIKGDTKNNEINNMITDMYMKSNQKKSNIKQVSMFDPNNTQPTDKKVTFNLGNNSNGAATTSTNPEDANAKKRKLAQNEKEQSNKLSAKKPASSSSSSPALANDLIKSPITFESFACDDELKENIFRRIYYILSPEHFQSNGKIPPRGFLLHGPPGCGKTQLVYAIAGVIISDFSLNKLRVGISN